MYTGRGVSGSGIKVGKFNNTVKECTPLIFFNTVFSLPRILGKPWIIISYSSVCIKLEMTN
jgi:hypothetical protein